MARILVALAVANFTAFFIGAILLGGDAASGKIEDGHYYLASHGRLTEVSAGAYQYSLWHVRSLFITHPLGMIAGAALYLGRGKRSG